MSLIETLVSIVAIAWVSAMSYSATRSMLVQARLQEARREAQQNANLAADVFAREVRMAGFSAAAEPLSAVRGATPSRIEIAADFNGDGDSDDSNERITYVYDADKKAVMRATGAGSPQPFVRNVADSSFKLVYVGADGAALNKGGAAVPAALRSRIARVVMEMSIDLTYRAAGGPVAQPVAIRVSVALRNA